MASRFGPSSLHQRDPRSALFEGYPGGSSRTTPSPGRAPLNGSVGGSSAAPYNAFRPATPNSRGQYSDAVLSELESQNDTQLEGMSAKVKMLKDITTAIGDEIRESSALAEKMNDSFESTRVRLRGTMNRMLRMAERTGVGWKVWLAFFSAVALLFWYVWLF
ncbi:MAG: protein transport protein bet1 [Geoglossum umbratile]|nr:MAG: protein transport protein bet1 [Geoglossum umbratile]